ncbi:zinc ABC transporter substrate-binding protein [Rhodoblastus acidophilus]|uniref:Zinc ABC transporter substrate-binding protein n=1 Tax=Candidatus Rhodoblastus alkanivorans TaxID=2954117 RepID=A0ABS9Z8S3_9HYPH|nr:zinc ABC transporter substrate-binding protein [Candidatus Rhodoblastus alkanivorans]MCI4677946.1 zinc ABC transporter substrate-binding protein [Candidatus Rhodoblastus alkanivorans]MCI4683841.1 zinc ABC transporter substrate-binding protein [Candidatus Rhodoblastus alkanivorans]MDI4641159.1 zinc ABC transporter substrate-binding protein [Rhodoblastus acidophilus]
MKSLSLLPAAWIFVCLAVSPALAAPVSVVAAENFYGDVARQIGGPDATVTSIMSNPDQDPHLFEASPSTARELSAAKIAISSGADYDPWMEKLLSAAKHPGRKVIVVAELVHKKAGDNPHIWYAPATMKALAQRLTADLSAVDPAHKADYQKREGAFIASLAPLEKKIAEMKEKYKGAAVTASEPVFGYMAQALGLKMRNEKFQIAVMNSTEPSVSDVAAFENDLKTHKVRVMLYNAQANAPAVQRLVKLAKDEKIPVVGITETEPSSMTYQSWMLSQLGALDKALAGPVQ